ncbi:uncharacterized protein LOC123878798 [Maniola jurtina]|uniref:uncharacterized protein LOC123878798 n=1 Tax=Maniola jurtina TaxID=191418 RepID=UPI001E688BFF|nr:uncharacterized protein LOC123878798 [Maniola jurtina]
MHALGILVLVVLFYGDVTFSWMAVPQDVETSQSAIETKENVTSPAPAIQCQTAKNITGLCTVREQCDFGPGGIDFTLYAPRWYKKPCKAGEVCCPYQFIQVQSQPAERSVESDDYFELDDDDYLLIKH